MDKQQRLEQLNRYREGPALTEEEIVAEYNKMYKQATPWTNPELFDPMNPPEGWEYDAWHAIWWKPPTASEYNLDMWIVRASFVLSAIVIGCIAFKHVQGLL